MDVDEIPPAKDSRSPKDPFAHLIDVYNAGRAIPVRSQGSLHGDREQFNSLLKAKKPSQKVLTNGVTTNSNGLDGFSKHNKSGGTTSIGRADSRPFVEGAEPKPAIKARLSKIEVQAMARRVFETKEYQSSMSPPPLRDFYGHRIKAHSRQAIFWSENQANSSFLCLPPNVRQRIYEHALGGHSITILYKCYGSVDDKVSVPLFKYYSQVLKRFHDPSRQNDTPRLEKRRSLSLLNGVCRQLYNETSTLPYKLNDIKFRTHNTMFNFFVMERRLSPYQLEAITELTVREELPGPAVLTLLPNLQRVKLLVDETALPVLAGDRRPPSIGFYRVVQGTKGRRFEKEQQTWTGYGRLKWKR
ncbi:hypothetical protein K458DRAFT_286252 [Lentithecium fluviatile CBS 122367]|uniref:DUF7730 domain-containing protein n=1 Tax=Lentithecium fluviatile CBS 122367 TaxID=1168545 RepID=A0A6G1JP81_9PLEO|nr:hypothetical protein K458DRAFT_286252 [Lentithecium fluviatile CBS 122367]